MSTIFAILALLAVSPKMTVGWENINPNRKEGEVAKEKLLWLADMRAEQAFRLEKLNGAEGSLEIRNGELRIIKSNAIGELVVDAKPFRLPSRVVAMFSVELTVESAVPGRSHGRLLVSPSLDDYGIQPEGARYDLGDGRNVAGGLIEQPVGMYYRKYAHYQGKDADVYPRIVIAGDPSVSTWRNWRAADFKDADVVHKQIQKESIARRRPFENAIVSAEEVARQCAASIDHTAKVVTENGVTYLTIDGQKVPPTLFHAVYHHSDYAEMTVGQPITSRGVPVTLAWLWGALEHNPAECTWTSADGFNVKTAADTFREMMRGDTNALYMIGFDCSAPKDYVPKCCPNEGWIDADDTPVYGLKYCTVNHGPDGKYPADSWPWVSMASPTWRKAVKENITALVNELKRTGHAKKLIGVHFIGYNDGQFSMNRPDYSPCAQAEYQKYLKAIEGKNLSTNYWQFCRQLGTLAQADFAHAFKQAMGKDVVAIRWDDSPFVVDYSHGTMNRDPNGIDITVSQPTYADRCPALGSAPYVPWSSLQLHNKMHWYELDLRTWWMNMELSFTGDNAAANSPDIEHWCSVYRKLAGTMIATHSGFWFYDMGRGWFAAPEVAADIGESLKVIRRLQERPASPWRSDVAVVVDEEGQFGVEGGRNFPWFHALYNICERQLDSLAAAGIPYDYYLAEDVISRPELVKNKKTVVFIFWRQFDARRLSAIKALSRPGQSQVFLCESGCLGGAKEATGFDINYATYGAWPYALKAEPDFKENLVGCFESEVRRNWLPEPGAKNPCTEARGRQVWIKPDPSVIVHARYQWDTNKVALAERRDAGLRRWYVAVPGGLTPELFSRIVRESGAYQPVEKTGLMVNMNGDFISVHALKGGEYDFKLPFPCRVVNVAADKNEPVDKGYLHLNLTPGETCWFVLER